jgi:hypothetical protein
MAGLLFYNINGSFDGKFLGKAMGTLVTMNGGFKGVPNKEKKSGENHRHKIGKIMGNCT